MSDEPITVDKTDQNTQEAIRSGEIDEPRMPEPETEVDEEGEERHSLAVDSAFVVFVQNGEAFGISSVGNLSVTMEGQEIHLEPTRRVESAEMWRACTEVAKDIQVQEQATATVAVFHQQAMRAQRAMQDAQVAQKLGMDPGGPGGLHVPGR